MWKQEIRFQVLVKLQQFFAWTWVAFSANLGGKPKDPKLSKDYPGVNKGVIFTCLMTGVVIWIGFRASITSELSSLEVKYPFTSLETLLDTKFT